MGHLVAARHIDATQSHAHWLRCRCVQWVYYSAGMYHEHTFCAAALRLQAFKVYEKTTYCHTIQLARNASRKIVLQE